MNSIRWMARSGLILAGIGALVDQQVSSTATYQGCARMTPPVVIAIGAGCAVLIAIGLFASASASRGLRESASDRHHLQVRFTAQLGIMASLFALLFVSVATAAALIVPSCYR